MDHRNLIDLLGSREAERDLIANLNRQLQDVNRRNRQLQNEIDRLKNRERDRQAEFSVRIKESTTAAYNDVNRARGELNDAQREIHRLTSNLAGLEREADQLRNRLQKTNDEMQAQADGIRDLIDQINDLKLKTKRDADENKKLQKELKDMADAARRAEEKQEEAERKLDRERELRTDLEHQLRTVRTELTTRVVPEPVQVISPSVNEDDLMRRQKELEDRIEKNYQSLREDFEKKLAQNKDAQNRLFGMREADLVAKNNDLIKELEEKNKSLIAATLKIKELNQQVRDLQAERTELLEKLDELSEERETQVRKFKEEIAKKDRILEEKIREKTRMLEQYGELLSDRTTLDKEIRIYQGLVTDEQERLRIREQN